MLRTTSVLKIKFDFPPPKKKKKIVWFSDQADLRKTRADLIKLRLYNFHLLG